MTKTTDPNVTEAANLIRGGDSRIAEQDRFAKLYLTDKGNRIFRDACHHVGGGARVDDAWIDEQAFRAVMAGY